ncbi:hypothetical protein [Roseovarius arcticus]|uniref:hypothetical protein n=1 Tax=Roseovarius arcticus TaxID=2547404 RepID=UPI0011102BB3|nr:hypothetical protein [Roseovarius arcticus]
MFAKLFKKQEPPEKVFHRTFEPRRLTRFPHKHTRADDLEDAPEPAPLQLAVRSIVPVEKAAPVINPLDHLHSDAPIPVDLLRRTLPERFREIDANTAEPNATSPSPFTRRSISGWSQNISNSEAETLGLPMDRLLRFCEQTAATRK